MSEELGTQLGDWVLSVAAIKDHLGNIIGALDDEKLDWEQTDPKIREEVQKAMYHIQSMLAQLDRG
jgi:hypothetical protein